MKFPRFGASRTPAKSVCFGFSGKGLFLSCCLLTGFLPQTLMAEAANPGFTPGELSVSPSGAAIYQVPIAVPPGVAGMQPDLSITYSSQGGNGLMGMGFGLNGLSTIYRCGGTIAQDGGNRSIMFDAEDNYCIDGQRLIPLDNNGGADGAEYRTEIGIFQKIVSYGQTGIGPSSFKAWSKSGQVVEFGTVDGAKRIDANSGSMVLWKLNKITDATGNYLDVEYFNNATTSESYPLSIQYGGNLQAATQHMVEVTFLYEERSDRTLDYSAGNAHLVNKTLSGIQSRVNGVLANEYKFRYDVPNINTPSKLLGVRRCLSQECLPELIFSWQESVPVFGERTPSEICKNGQTAYGQCNGDNNHDYIWYPDVNGDGNADLCYRSDLGIKCFLGQGDGSWGDYISTDICANSSLLYGGCNGPSNYGSIKFIDLNLDGNDDIVFRSDSGLRTLISNGNGFVEQGTSTACADGSLEYGVCNGDNNHDYIWYPDVNGDAIPDVCFRSDQGINCFKGDGQGNWIDFFSTDICANASIQYGGCDGLQNYNSISFADVNQDRMADIVFKANAGLRTLLSHGNGFMEGSHSTACADGSLEYGVCNGDNNYPYIWHPDINGDAVPDVCFRSDQGINCFLGDGAGGWKNYIQTNICANASTAYGICNYDDNFKTISFIDINTDGKQDLVFRSDSGLRVLYSNGLGFEEGLSTDICANGSSSYGVCNGDNNHYSIRFPDLNGDGKPDIAYRGDEGVQNFIQHDYEPLLLSSIADSLGTVTSIQYSGVTDISVYEAGITSPLSPEVINLITKGGFNLVSVITIDTATAENAVVSYRYGEGKLNTHGRGFLGFAWMQAANEQTGIVTKTDYRQDFPYTGQVSRTEQRLADGTLLGETDVTFAEITSFDGKVHFPYAATSVDESYELDGTYISTTTTQNTYDAYGNALRIIVTTTDGVEQVVKDTLSDYTNNTDEWHLGRLTRATVSHTNAQGALTRTSAFEYNTDGLLSKEIIEPDSAVLRLETSYTYDSFGNKLTATTSGQGITPRTSATAYSADGRFPVTVTNALSHSESRTYDPIHGVMLTLTGPNGLITSWSYDSFGRKTREDRADGTWTTITRGICAEDGTGCPANAPMGTILFTTTEASGSPPASEYADKLGRVTRKERVGFDGSAVFTDTEYNRLGQIARVTKPYFTDDTLYWTRYEYDTLGRVVLEASPTESDPGALNGNNDVMRIHQGLAVTEINVNNHETTRFKNLQGKLSEVIDEEFGGAGYVYDAIGNLLRNSDGIRVLSEMAYDARGRKTGMVDADMGIWSYQYNVIGELISQTDAKGQTVTMEYDTLGRMIRRVEPEGETTWTYDTATKGIGKLAQVNGPSGYQQSTNYDQYGRANATTTTTNGESFIQSISYDAYGRVTSKTSPTGFVIANQYNAQGFLAAVSNTDGSTVYWHADSVDAQGHALLSTLGNGLETVRQYDAAQGYLKGILTGNGGSVQYLTYDFDDIGNLISREDANQSLSETFIYDGLNRLTSATVAASGALPAITKSYTYDSVGNITNKSDVGDYLYGTGIQNGAGVHAVTQAGSDTYTYDANGNMSGGAGRTIIWASFNKPLSIIRGNDSVSFEYDADHNRIRSDVIKNYTETTTTVYLGKSYERVTLDQGIVEHKHYIQVAGATVLYTERSNNISDTRYLHQDHLGSTDVITNENAQVVERNSFDAFGSRRQTNWQDPLSQLFSQFSRGYTGHEQFDGVGLIHMNGRVYDARLGRFLSADPHVQSLANPQSLNRYTYVNNNPLSFTDPSGYFFKKLFKMIHKNILLVSGSKSALGIIRKNPWVGVIVQAVAAYFCGPCAAGVAALITEANGGSFSDMLKAAAISYVSAQAYSTLHGSLGSGFTKVVAHGVVGGLSSAASGGKFKHGFLSAGFAQAFSGNISKGFPDSMPSRVIAAAVIGGTASKLGGGKFANGAVTGAFAHLFSNMPAANDDNYGMVSDAEMNYIMATSPRTSALWEVPQSVVDAVAGFGDTISFGATNWIRGQLDVNGAVNFDSAAYQGGEYAGYAYFATAGGIAVARGAVALSPGGQIIGHPAYGGRTIAGLRSGQFRFGWSRNNGPTLRMGVRSKHIDFVRLRPPGQ